MSASPQLRAAFKAACFRLIQEEFAAFPAGPLREYAKTVVLIRILDAQTVRTWRRASAPFTQTASGAEVRRDLVESAGVLWEQMTPDQHDQATRLGYELPPE